MAQAPQATIDGVPPDAFAALDAMAQAELVRRGEVQARDLVDAAIRRIEALNPALNAVVTRTFEDALAQAARIGPGDGQPPLAGAPYLIKDLDDLAGVRCTRGSRLYAQHVSTTTAPVVRKAQAAGLVMLGKTNTPEFGLTTTTQSRLLGPAHNPWNLGHSPGGSSGGAAAAVASGMVPAAHATDGGGSIRMPASCCGVFGLKPSRGRMRLEGVMPGDIGVENCVSRTVRDSAMILSLSEDRAGSAPLPPTGFVAGPSRQRLRIAFCTANLYGAEPHPHVREALEDVARLCADLGHRVEPVRRSLDGHRFIDAFVTLWTCAAAQFRELARAAGESPEAVLEPWTLGLAELYARKPAGALAEAVATLRSVAREVDAFFEDYDVWLTPVLFSPPPALAVQAPDVAFDAHYDHVIRYCSYTPLHNAAGTPAMSVPLSWTSAGLPVGSQFAARVGDEGRLLALAYELEAARPWRHRWPPVSARAAPAAADARAARRPGPSATPAHPSSSETP